MVRVMGAYLIFYNISAVTPWWSCSMVVETEVPDENHHWQAFSHRVVCFVQAQLATGANRTHKLVVLCNDCD